MSPGNSSPDYPHLTMRLARVKDLKSPAKKWKLEKNAQQLFLTGTVLLYQVPGR